MVDEAPMGDRRARSWSGLGLALALALPGASASQAPDLATLRARAAASPEDDHAACELAFALVTAGQSAEAVTVATPAIARLRAQPGAAPRRTLGACLYNRGRAHETLGQTNETIVDYADSLDLRPNETVANRLHTLVPDAPADPPLAAIAATVPDFVLGAETTVTRARDAAGHAWLFVTSSRGESPMLVAITRPCGEPRAIELDRAWFDNYGTVSVDRASARRLGALDAIVVEVGGAGDATCHRMDGVMDAEHEATAVAWIDACTIASRTFVSQELVCDDSDDEDPHEHGYRVRIDPSGSVVTTRVRGRHAADDEIGTFVLGAASH